VEHGTVVTKRYSPYFGRVVDLFCAANDLEKRTLYRASVLAQKLNCAINKVGMYLARHREFQDDIYQATSFRNKPTGTTGLKSGGYFISLKACKKFEENYAIKPEFNLSSRISDHPSVSDYRQVKTMERSPSHQPMLTPAITYAVHSPAFRASDSGTIASPVSLQSPPVMPAASRPWPSSPSQSQFMAFQHHHQMYGMPGPQAPTSSYFNPNMVQHPGMYPMMYYDPRAMPHATSAARKSTSAYRPPPDPKRRI